jgi:hypothetical protein
MKAGKGGGLVAGETEVWVDWGRAEGLEEEEEELAGAGRVREVEFLVAAAATAFCDRDDRDKENGGALCGFAFVQGMTTRRDRAR